MAKKRLFGLDPKKLDKILSIGTEDHDGPDIEDRKPFTTGEDTSVKRIDSPSATASLEIFTEKPGSQIDKYKLLHVLGEGGMGIVYLAEQKHPIRRQVALKVIKPGMDSKRVIARFEAERQALALLDHPNIAHVHDAGTTESGRPYFVMEYVKGLSIIEYCDRHKLTIEERLDLFRQICLAVHHAHQKGIIHRDIKPSNILVSTEDDKATPKIIDFGVAKAIAQPLTERTLATEESQLLGTPEYMSPEQADMATEDIDTRSDIYSLGVLLYVLLTGVLPFDSDTLRTGGIEHIRQIIREIDPKTPSTRLTRLGEEAKKVAEKRRTEVGALAKCLHRELEWIPLKAMRKERSERYRSASEFADDIENYLKGTPLLAGPPSVIYRLKKFIRRNRVLVAAAFIVAVTFLLGLVATTTMYLRAEHQAQISEAISTFLRNDLLASVNPGRGKGRDVTVRSFLDTASESLNGKFKNEPLVEASIRDTIGSTYRDLGEQEAAEPHLERALQIRQEYLGTEHLDTLDSVDILAWLRFDQARYEEAAELLENAMSTSRRVLGEEHIRMLSFANTLGCVYICLGLYDDAEQLYLKGIPTALRVLGEKNNLSLFMVGNLGQTYTAQGRYNEAERKLLETLRLRDGFWDDENIWTLTYEGFLADLYIKQKRYDDAERLYRKILPIQRRIDKHYRTLWSVGGLAQVCTCLRKYDEAEKFFAEALEGWRKQLGDNHPGTLRCKNDLAVLYKEQARYEDAEPLLLEAINGRRLKLGDTHPHTLQSFNNLIELYEAWGKSEKAEECRAKLPQTEAVDE
jgi:serine/threonine protein kinase